MTDLSVARALQGDDDALAEYGRWHPPSVAVTERTRERMRDLPARCAAAVVNVTDLAERERLLRIEFEKAMIEFAPLAGKAN